MHTSYRLIALAIISANALTSCTSINPYTGTQQASRSSSGAVIGALIGAGLGSLTGDGSTGRRQNAMIGAAIGSLAGGGIGNYMDRQESELRAELQSTGVSVTRNGNEIILNMPSDITFPTNSSNINSRFYGTLRSVSKVIAKYKQNSVEISGHTDSTGNYSSNMELSSRRAESVASFLQNQGVSYQRISTQGYGPNYPVASNNSSSGKQLNRRAEIKLRPNQPQSAYSGYQGNQVVY
jgi:outer membrane protein OmpA-like peptidoglycan-associated protein